MDWINSGEAVADYLKKYKYIILLIAVGIFFMILPVSSQKNQEKKVEAEVEYVFEDALEEILCQISGAGDVCVLLTEKRGQKITYQMDENRSADSAQKDTVIISDSDRGEHGLVLQTEPPVYLGALVLCQGAENANVRLSIVKAVMSVTGLSSDRITVLKMK